MQGPWNNSESGAARSYKLANKRRPHNSASCNGYKWRLCAPLIPSGIIARPSPSIHVLLELNEETERGRETIVAGMKRTLGNTGVTIDRFERRIDRKFSPSQTPALSPGSWPYLERTRIFSDRRANVRKTLFSPSSNSNAIFEKKFSMEEKIYIY